MMLRACVLSVIFSDVISIGLAVGDPIYTWPLYSKQPKHEIQLNGVFNTCPRTPGELHPTLGYNGVYLKGTPSSYVDLRVDVGLDTEDFSLVVFVKAHTSDEGTIFHYRAESNSEDTSEHVSDVLLFYNATHTCLSLMGSFGELLGNIQNTFESHLYNDKWIGFAAVYHIKQRKLELLVETDGKSDTTLTKKLKLRKPGIIRVGGSFDEINPSFQGDVICFNFYDLKIKEGDFDAILRECSMSNWQYDESNQTCEGHTGYFEIVQKNCAIDSSTSALNEYPTSSRIKCSNFCERLDQCVSFIIDLHTGTCRLYDQDYTANIIQSNDSHYYRKKNPCC